MTMLEHKIGVSPDADHWRKCANEAIRDQIECNGFREYYAAPIDNETFERLTGFCAPKRTCRIVLLAAEPHKAFPFGMFALVCVLRSEESQRDHEQNARELAALRERAQVPERKEWLFRGHVAVSDAMRGYPQLRLIEDCEPVHVVVSAWQTEDRAA